MHLAVGFRKCQSREYMFPFWGTNQNAASCFHKLQTLKATDANCNLICFQMFEPPITLIESKKQKSVFEDVDGSKVIGYLEKDSPGIVMEVIMNFEHSSVN